MSPATKYSDYTAPYEVEKKKDMGPIDRTELAKGGSAKWILESIEIDSIADVPDDDGDQPGSIPKNTNQPSFERQISNLRKRNGVPGNNPPF